MTFQSPNPDQDQAAGGIESGEGARDRLAALAEFASHPRIQRIAATAPRRGTIALILLGMVIGLITAYLIIPAEFTGASPRRLSPQFTQQWVRMIAVGHSEAIHYDDANALIVLRQIPNPQDMVNGLVNNGNIPAAERAALDALTDIPGFADLRGASAPQDPGIVMSGLQLVLALGAVAAGAIVLVIAARLASSPGFSGEGTQLEEAVQSRSSQVQARSPADVGAQPQAYAEGPAGWDQDETELSGGIHPHYGAPVLHALSTYVKGRNYDDSFAIELAPEAGGQFLGECGLSAATHVGNELQSVELWGFDMASQETLTKVFAAPAALSDPAMQATLANRVRDLTTDLVAAEPGAALILDGGAIHIQAVVKTVICNYGGGTPNSGIETMQIELLAWHKQTVQAGLPASGYPAPAASPFNEYADLQLGPPAETTSPSPPPAASGAFAPRPANTPLKAKRPEDDQDDPFGGTGNFMPYS